MLLTDQGLARWCMCVVYQIEISIVDIWTDYAPWPYNQAVPAYQFMAKNPVYWKAFWEYGK